MARSVDIVRILLAWGLITSAGCGKPAPLRKAPVTGKVTFESKPVSGGTLRFLPNADKGNTSKVPFICVGQIGPQGEYELSTDRGDDADTGPGAPLGWYKVVYHPARNATAIKVDSSYLSVVSTPLSIEVVENPQPGQYDIVLK
jgi:hypothetical protein